MARRLARVAASMMVVVCLSPVIAGWSPDRNGQSAPEVVGTGSVAGGHAHTLLATPDGRVFAWGGGDRGQIGDGALMDRWSPVQVAGLEGVVAVAAGAAHSMALTKSGDVYAWGANASGRLGDGTRQRRPRPVKVLGLSGVRVVAAGLAHTLAVTTDGRVFAWGANDAGQLGNGNRTDSWVPIPVIGLSNIVAVAAGDSHSLAVARDGRLFAWGGNSLSAIGDGTTTDRLVPVAIGLVNVVAVAAGAEHSLALLSSGAVYSWGRGANGELGTGSTQSSSSPQRLFGVDATAIAAGRHFSAAIRRDQQVLTWGANGSGQLGDGTTTRRLRPVVVVGVDTATLLALGDAHAIAVRTGGDVRSWGEGASGRLGLGSELDQSVPSEISGDVLDWDGGDVGPVDTTAPSIIASTSPPLHAGWMTTPVTVTFTCSDDVAIASCSGPVTIAQDGAAQQVVGTAVDQSGNQTSTSVSINMDVNPPILSISQPQDAAVVASSETIVLGTANDLGSGIADARCNGGPAELINGTIRCTVQLQPGRNEVILHATDVVGHNASAAVTVTRTGVTTRISLTPKTLAATVNEVIALSLRDEYGALVEAAQWSTSDDAIVALSDDVPPVVTAVGIGEAIVTAERDGINATASIIVSAALEPGAVRWTLPALPNATPGQPLFANRVDAATPHLFTVESERWGEATLRAVNSDGQVLWHQHSPGVPLMGDSFGGVLAGVLNADDEYRAYLRLGGGSIRPWRFESAGTLGRPAQSSQGTIYSIEYLSGGLDIEGKEIWDKYAIVLDGATGQLMSRTLMPREVDEFISDRDGEVLDTVPPTYCRSKRYEYAPRTWGPFAGGDGRGYFLVRRYQLLKWGGCTEPFQRRPDRSISMGLDLVIVSATDDTETINIYSSDCTGALGTTLPCDVPVRAFQVMPDGIGGTLVTWERGTQMVGQSVFIQKSLTRVAAEGIVERPVPPTFWLEMIGQSGTAITYDDGWKAQDVATGAIQWAQALPALAVLAARPDGGVATLDTQTGELKITNGSGEIETTQPFGLDWYAVHAFGDWIGMRNNSLTAVVGQFADATRWAALKGNVQAQLSLSRPGMGIWLKTHNAFEPMELYQHASLRVTPFNQKWLLENAQRFETCSDSQSCVPLGIDDFGNRFFTIGAGTASSDTALRCAGFLTKGLNRPNDVRTPPDAPPIELPIDLRLQGLVIDSLLSSFDAYQNDLQYYCFPEERTGFYNSNSFTHGLLHAASVGHNEGPPTRRLLPGWLTPVPVTSFGR